MWRDILKYGVIGGVVVALGMFATLAAFGGQMPHGVMGMAIGYATMLLAFSAVFMGIKRHRDVAGAGLIRFWPAFGLGLAISFITAIFYVLAWELAQATVVSDFAGDYIKQVIEQQKASGLDGDALDRLVADMQAFERQYANPMFRLPMTFAEIFPVGVLVSLVSALVLRKSTRVSPRG